jgi:hypothetical protein
MQRRPSGSDRRLVLGLIAFGLFVLGFILFIAYLSFLRLP